MKRRIQKLLILLIAAALMACCTPGCGTVTPAPTPTGTPDSTPTPATTPSPTPDDTAVPPATAEPVVTPEPAPSQSPTLTDEERMAEIEAFLNEKSSNYLLNKIFTDVRSLSLLSFFAGYCDDSILYSEAKALYNDLQGYTYRYDVNYITGDKLKDRIHSLTGLSLSDYHTGSVMYIPERDMYITESINPRYHPVICKSITSDGDLYTVIYRSADFGISVVSGDLYEFRAMSVTLRSLGSGKYEFVSNQPHFFPEDEHAKKLYEIGVFLNTMPYNGMLHLQYESIDDIRICELLYQCQDETLSYEDAIAACKAADVAIESPITYMRGTELDKLLKSITGFGLSDKDWDFHGVRYLTDADLYFVMHSDTNYYPVSCHSHIIDGDIHIVTYDTPSSTSLSKDYTVTLRDLGNGEYQFISNISVPEQLNYDAFLLSEISDFINFYENTGFRLSDESFMLSQVIPYIKDSSIPQDTVISKLNAAGYSITKDVSCISREALDKFLIKKTGRALGSFNLEHQDGLIYLPDMDIYCVQTDHSTPPPQPAVSCISCVRDGNYVTAHCRISKSDKHYEYFHFRNYQGKVIETDDLYITLKYSVEEGQYRFVSCSSTANDYPHAPALIE